MNFRSRSNLSSTVCVSGGSLEAPIFEERVDSDGRLFLKKTGVRDLNAFVQEGKDATLIYNILERFNAGDVSAINKVRGFYEDVTAMPKTLFEVHNFMRKLSTDFDSLPVDLKSKFGNSSHEFLKSVENGDFVKILNEFNSNSKVSKTDGSVENGDFVKILNEFNSNSKVSKTDGSVDNSSKKDGDVIA